MALRPPQHRIDAPILFVHATDTAWDEERIQREQQAMRSADPPQEASSHPVARYLGGFTRYDLDAAATVLGQVVTVRDYLDDAKQPTIWKLRRLSADEWYDVHPLFERDVRRGEKPWACYIRCGKLGVSKVENGPALELIAGRMTTADVAKIDAIGRSMLYDIGEAVYQASMDLREDERRPLG